jgi:hypothetical protein
MERVSDHIRNHLLEGLEMPDSIPSLDILQKTEWSEEFENFMRNRLIMGRFRYGPFQNINRTPEAVIENIKLRADKYIKERNTEYLVDIANLCMKVFVVDDHPRKHFKSEDDKNHTKQK